MNAKSSSLSPELLKANQRLHELRQLAQSNKTMTRSSGQKPPWEETSTEAALTTVDAITQLPPHLGWDSEFASRAIRNAIARHRPESDPVEDEQLRADHPFFRSISDGSHSGGQPLGVSEHDTVGTQLRLPLDDDTVKHYPYIGIAALNEEQAAIYTRRGRFLTVPPLVKMSDYARCEYIVSGSCAGIWM